jgi:hypothetical protein
MKFLRHTLTKFCLSVSEMAAATRPVLIQEVGRRGAGQRAGQRGHPVRVRRLEQLVASPAHSTVTMSEAMLNSVRWIGF